MIDLSQPGTWLRPDVLLGIVSVIWTLYYTVVLFRSSSASGQRQPILTHLLSILTDVGFLILMLTQNNSFWYSVSLVGWLAAIAYTVYDARSQYIPTGKTLVFLVFARNAKHHPNYILMRDATSFMVMYIVLTALQIYIATTMFLRLAHL